MVPSQYSDLIALDSDDDASGEALVPVHVGASTSEGGISEQRLRDLLFQFPEALPIDAINSAYKGVVPVCRELYTRAGYLDALYANPSGRLVLAEFKLWRNPEARREVIRQILDYAKELASWNYEKLQSSVSQALGEKGNVLYELVRERHPETDEAVFVDNVARYLKRGECLLLILGDGIRKEVEEIGGFVQKHGGLHFDLALVEAAVWRDGARLPVQPRVLMRTKIVRRTVVEGGLEQDAGVEDCTEDTLSDQEEENLRFWTAVTNDYAFSDDTVEPPVIDGTTLFVKVRNSGFSGWALQFTGSLSRKPAGLRCYLTWRKEASKFRKFALSALYSDSLIRAI